MVCCFLFIYHYQIQKCCCVKNVSNFDIRLAYAYGIKVSLIFELNRHTNKIIVERRAFGYHELTESKK